jgi:eukaryotic-like serine/threonine-protein kinase
MSQNPQACMQCSSPIPVEFVQCPHCSFELGSGEAPEAWMGETIDGKYGIEEILGVGGMGMVFRATRLLIGDEVALKILFPKFLKNKLQHRLFLDEAVATAALDHPNVITIYDMEIDSNFGVAYMAMELLEGFTFKELMLSEAPMAAERLYPIFTQVCDGLSSAHEVGIIHRDLKPDNLFLSKAADGGFHVKVLDFGIATVMGQYHADESNKLLGTLRYMAPEQCRGDAVSPPTDLYALGVILYESLTRQRATGKSVESVLYDQIRSVNDRLPSDKAISQHFEALIMRLLSKEIHKRPQSALELKEAILTIADPLRSKVKPMKQNRQRPLSSVKSQTEIDGGLEWEKKDLTPILDVDHSTEGISILWYIIPAGLFCILIYFLSSVY